MSAKLDWLACQPRVGLAVNDKKPLANQGEGIAEERREAHLPPLAQVSWSQVHHLAIGQGEPSQQ